MTDHAEAERINEFEVMFYEFSPRGFTDGVYNACVDSWSEVTEEVLLKDAELRKFAGNKEFRQELLSLLFTTGNGCFKTILNQFTDFALRYIFRISDAVTLPIHQGMQELLAGGLKNDDMYDVKREEKRAKKLEEQLVAKRFELADLNAQLKEAEDVLSVFRHMEKSLETKRRESMNFEETQRSPGGERRRESAV